MRNGSERARGRSHGGSGRLTVVKRDTGCPTHVILHQIGEDFSVKKVRYIVRGGLTQ